MNKAFLPVCALLAAVSCADKKFNADIIKLFERHSYQEHAPQKIKELLDARGAAGLHLLDKYAEVIKARKQFKRAPPAGPAAVSSGLLIGGRGGGFHLLRAFQKSPALAAGLKDGDRILEVNGIKASSETLSREIQGRGEFRLKVERAVRGRGPGAGGQGSGAGALKKSLGTFEAGVKKTDFAFPVVFGFYEPGTKTAFVRISVFFEGSSGMVLSGLDTLVRSGAKKVIFDLRNNRGGMPDEAAAILDCFAAKAGPVLELKSRHKGYSRRFDAPGKGKFAGLKAAALVGGGTSMTAEAFAAALKDVAGAAIVGGTTRGNVSLQRAFKLGRKNFQLTVARLFPPSGRDLEGTGLTPEHSVELSKERAASLKKAWDSSSETVLLDDPFYLKAIKVLSK
ncbi:MAG: hypothetical protein KKH28_04630 [Elusimicrobia bacterium]|nr:hypothetical protein [Elusimicrobiota bacterium]